MSEAQELEAAKKRILAALQAGDWQQFRQYCCPNIAIEEYWRLYMDYLAKNVSQAARSGTLFPLSEGSQAKAIVFGIRIAIKKPLAYEERTAFTRFCANVRDTLSGKPNFDQVSIAREAEGDEYQAFCGTAITGKVASNVHWWIQLEQYRGEWKVRRLVLEGH